MGGSRLILLAILTVLSILGAGKLLLPESRFDASNMIWLESGYFQMGSDKGMPDESPAHQVALDGYWIDKFEVTNRKYQQFVEETGYKTYSELVGDSLVFESPEENRASPLDPLDWWHLVEFADWRHPQGPQDSIVGKLDHPVVHVTYADALAFCDWQLKELPTEAQFEYAARGGRQGEIYSWGNKPLHDTGTVINNWQGSFPTNNDSRDGYKTTAPVGSFAANDYGLYDISGNVWEWVSDWYHPRYYAISPLKNPQGVEKDSSIDPAEPSLAKRGIRGGSFLCSDDYCSGFRVSARMPAEPTSSTNHTGFRCVKNYSPMERLLNR